MKPGKTMNSAEILNIHYDLTSGKIDPLTIIDPEQNPLILDPKARLNSVSIEDALFGDGGKGAKTVKVNKRFRDKGMDVFSFRANGGANAGHETFIDGKLIVTNQLPSGVLQEGVTPVMSRGMIVHPRDLLLEIDTVKEQFGGNLPSDPLIDRWAILGLDTHRALEKAIKCITTGSGGSTNKAIAQAYASFYDRTAVFIDTLLDDDEWESNLRKHYDYINGHLRGFGSDFQLENSTVSAYDDYAGEHHRVGTQDEFINGLREQRKELKQYVPEDVQELMKNAWKDTSTAFTVEFGQGAGLDPWFGIYPDVTASRTTSRNLPDVTYGIVQPERIAIRGTVFKTIYMSSVGERRLPEIPENYDIDNLRAIQEENREYGKTTGRPRPPKHISMPLFQAQLDYSGAGLLLPTHLDSGKTDRPIQIIAEYRDKVTKKEKPYHPMQKEIDKLETGSIIVFDGYDGDKAKEATHPSELPHNLQVLLAFYHLTTRPIALGSTGPGPDDYISWLGDNA